MLTIVPEKSVNRPKVEMVDTNTDPQTQTEQRLQKPNSFPLGKKSRLITYFTNIPNGKMPVSQMV
jgi:hypothetical protein